MLLMIAGKKEETQNLEFCRGGGGRRWELVGLGMWLGHGGWHGTEVLRVFWVDCLGVDKRKGSFSLDLGSPVCWCRCDGRACGDYRGRDPV